ncbi:MAG: hypothetical protein A07HN63_00980 [uncultured archaeon A07HN63]|nr:MAG: hypothetical protein A07HN63_00980 [uncultured archaeon A07HN63]
MIILPGEKNQTGRIIAAVTVACILIGATLVPLGVAAQSTNTTGDPQPSIAEIKSIISSFGSPTTTAKPELEDAETDLPGVTVTPVETQLVNAITFDTEGLSGSVKITEYADPPAVIRRRMSESIRSTDSINVGGEDADSGDSIDVIAVANITPTTEEAEESAATMRLRLEESKVENPEQLTVIKEIYDDEAKKPRWEQLNTTVESTGSNTVTFTAQVDEFSLFAVTEIQQQRSGGGEAQQRQAVQQQTEQHQGEDTAPLLRLLASAVVLLGIFATAGFYIRRNYTGTLKKVSTTDIMFWRDNDSTEITADEFDWGPIDEESESE